MLGFGNFFGDVGVGGLFGPRFSTELRCYPVSFIGRNDLEAGNRLVLPPSALESLSRQSVPNPMHFEISDLDGNHRTHGGVLEFVAPEEVCYMPAWILRQMRAEDGDVLRIALKTLPKATLVRLRPASVALLRVFNPRALLENGLRNFAALTVGDSFAVEYNGQFYGLEVVEAKPANAVSVVEADVEVEFATPKDAISRDPELANAPELSRDGEGQPHVGGYTLFGGAGHRIDGEDVGRAGAAETDSDTDDMPWKRRIPTGVKWTTAPYGCEKIRICGEAGRVSSASSILKEPVDPYPAIEEQPPTKLGGAGAEGHSAVALALEAAEVRMAMQADEINKRRQEEEEEQARQKAAEEERQAQLRAAGEARRQRAAAVAAAVAQQQGASMQAPAQVQMAGSGGAASGKAGATAARASSSQGSWCGCCGPGLGKKADPPSRV